MLRSNRLVLAGGTLFAALLVAGTAAAGHYQDALQEALAKAGGKPVLVDFYTDW
jgi:thiol:disulfide interchange protein